MLLGDEGHDTHTLAMHRADLQVAVQPLLVQDIAARHSLAPTSAARRQHVQGFATHGFPISAAALAISPARADLPSMAPVAAPGVSGPATRPVDPRIAFCRALPRTSNVRRHPERRLPALALQHLSG
ncbi:hypothetical protein ACIPPM_01315 [Streptomyces sp. NPDC090119]|uniref:hypothetical protein n=1 Tax=Streptomyces sp. NPDC090119 TaxID=3365951 RepID=UPI00380FDF1F